MTAGVEARRSLVLMVAAACASEDSAPPHPGFGTDDPESAATTWIDLVDPLPEHWSGEVGAYVADSGSGIDAYSAVARFEAPGPNPTWRVGAVALDLLDGVDDCGVQRTTDDVETSTTAPERTRLDPGGLALGLPDGTVIDLVLDGDSWVADLLSQGLEPVGGTVHRFSSTGGDLPVFEIDVTLPDPIALTAPDLRDGVPTGDTEVQWTGTGSGEVVFEAGYIEEPEFTSVILTCRFADDGTATVPGELFDLLPGGAGGWSLTRVTEEEVTLSDGQIVGATGAAQWLVLTY